ncbi:ECF-type sigma factor [Pseudoxanthomonas sp. PXM04]|uniref:ECF-type sigma factor n=1 Tax=Pseudoxanthomonas sp. PXM04 TaxID=2769297 RepID=UPI00177D0DA1|nr:ECF-type sigma factor [Pseudoxanthomonas sp. PXM04]MBD9379379.1 RNA polymerase subunit sigma-70 [Pseudoxanthomonas sp. PXM04]
MGDDLTRLLQGWRAGDAMARDRLLSDVYDTLREMARMRWHRHGASHTLQPTAVVNEAMLRLLGNEIDWQDRAHFFAMAALKMRAVMVDHARVQLAEKRGGEVAVLTLSHAESVAGNEAFDVLALDLALQRLARRDPRAAQGLEMAYFGGMERDEIACVLGVSPSTIDRDLKVAKAWLRKELA